MFRTGVLFVTLVLGFGAAAAETLTLDDFTGTYEGRGISRQSGSLDVTKRDMNVAIKRKGDGFTVAWTTIKPPRKGETKVRRKSYTINFKVTRRQNIFAAAMAVNIFGATQPLDPMKGDPYVWARIRGRTLSVYAMIITDAGGYEMQTYDRTLTRDGMTLRFTRFRDGEALRVVEGNLAKVD